MKQKSIRPVNFAYLITYFITIMFYLAGLFLLYMIFIIGYSIEYFELISIILCISIFTIFSCHFLRVRTKLSNGRIVLVKSMWLKKDKTKKRMIFIFSEGNLELRIVTEEFEVSQIKRYGYSTDLGVEQKEQKPTFMYAVKEIVFELEDGTDCRININHYTRRAIRKLIMYIIDVSGKHPTGELKNILV